MWVRQFRLDRDRGKIDEAEARQLRITSRRGMVEADAGCSRPRQGRGRMFETEGRHSENHVNDDMRNFDNKLNKFLT